MKPTLLAAPKEVGSLAPVKTWICYGKRAGPELTGPPVARDPMKPASFPAHGSGAGEAGSSLHQLERPGRDPKWSGMTKLIYNQQNMIQCFEERNFYRLLFAFFDSLATTFTHSAGNFMNRKPEKTRAENEIEFLREQLMEPGSNQRTQPATGRRVPLDWFLPDQSVGSNPRKFEQPLNSKKLILFGRSEVKRLFRKVLLMKPESILFSQIFLIPIGTFFGILYTFWTFSVSATDTFVEYIPIARMGAMKRHIVRSLEPTGLEPPGSEELDWSLTQQTKGPIGFCTNSSSDGSSWLLPTAVQKNDLQMKLDHWRPFGQQLIKLANPTGPSSELGSEVEATGEAGPEEISRLLANEENEPSAAGHSDGADETGYDFDEYSPTHLDDLTFFTSYKVDWSPTRGVSDLLRLTNIASKTFILWASFFVFRSLRPVKANRPEMRIQTRFLRPFQNRKRFRDLEGIEKFSGVLKTLTESIQGSFKDPLFYIVLLMPNFPFFQPFQKAIGKFRFFLFYGKQTEFLRKPFTLLIGFLSPREKQKQAQTYPKGYLFIGPPGTGKTLLAQAIAGESKVNFICLSASEIQKQIDIGTRIGALRLRNLFEEARTLTPCILFFDEIDTLGRARQGNEPFKTRAGDSTNPGNEGSFDPSTSTGPGRPKPAEHSFSRGLPGNPPGSAAVKSLAAPRQLPQLRSSQRRSVNRTESASPSGVGRNEPNRHTGGESEQGRMKSASDLDLKLFTEFLVQMDSFSVKDGFLVIGTTNFLSSLDPAFIRSGRFDRILGLTYPPKQTRIAILKLHIRKKGNFFERTLPWNIFGFRTKDLSPADLAKVVNESSLYLLNHLNDFEPARQDLVVNQISSGNLKKSDQVGGTKSDSPLGPQQPRKLAPLFTGFLEFTKALFSFQPGLIHTSRSLREGFVKILESKKE
jgi:hypothetical protein